MAVGRPPPSTLPCSLRPPASGRTRGRVAKRVATSEEKCNCEETRSDEAAVTVVSLAPPNARA